MNLTVVDVHVRTGERGQFVVLELEGTPVMVQGVNTGRWFLTARRCRITTTFSEATARKLIGSTIPGNIERVECDPYEYTIPATAEVVTLSHRWEFQPEQSAQGVPATQH